MAEPAPCFGAGDPAYLAYHDEEWGRPVRDERGVYERLCLEGFQSGLSWLTILRKRPAFRLAFAGFEPEAVARFDESDVERLLGDAAIVRHRGKIEAAIVNARATLALRAAGTPLQTVFWAHAPVAAAAPRSSAELPSSTPDSALLARRLAREGFRFVGPTTAYAAMQACGVVNDHLVGCPVRDEVERGAGRLMLDERVRGVLARLEAEDEADAARAAPHDERSLAIAPTSGALLYALCGRRPGTAVLEIGGSRGYSTIWLAAAARALGGRVTSLEADPRKLERSARNIAEAGLADWVEVRPGDAFETLPGLEGPYDLVFLDAWKDDYEALFALALGKLAPGGVVVADNVLSHVTTLAAYSAARQADPRLVSVTVPLDNGLEVTAVLTGGLHSD